MIMTHELIDGLDPIYGDRREDTENALTSLGTDDLGRRLNYMTDRAKVLGLWNFAAILREAAGALASPAPPPMAPERAHEIVVAINDRLLFRLGLKEPADIGSLAGVSLAEMLEAKAIVLAGNESARARQVRDGGSISIYMTPDDRLIAAAYALEHYRPDNEAVVVVPTAEWPYDRRALGVIGLEPGQGEADDEG